MNVELRIQDPSRPRPVYGVDAIVSAAEGATRGLGVFAFATVTGVDLLLEHESIRALTTLGTFELVVGIDAITNRQTLERLSDIARNRKGLHPKVFWNSSGGIFHPKFCLFSNATRETWIVGSGNLTPRGLRDSYETFAVIRGKPTEFREMRETLRRFLDAHTSDIRDIDDEALARAAKNTFSQPVGTIELPGSSALSRKTGARAGDGRVLVAELPRGGTRWQQANFDRDTAREFFGVIPEGSSLRMELFFSELDSAGLGVSEEVRRFTFTRSKNLRVQLAAKAGAEYPDHGRPIAVFREVKPRHFVYQLLLPGDRGMTSLKDLLRKNVSGEVRRFITSVGVLHAAWPGSPLC